MHDADALAGYLYALGDLHRVVVHEDDVGSFNGGVGAHRAHGDADISAGEHRRVVDAVADEGELAAAFELGEQHFDLVDLVAGQQLAVDLVDSEILCRVLRDPVSVAGEHDGLGDAGALERGDGILCVGLLNI